MTSFTKRWKHIEGGLEIYVPKEFNFEANLGYLGRDNQECMFEVDSKSVTRVIDCGKNKVLVKITGHENNPLQINFITDVHSNSEEQKNTVAHFIWDWFDLDCDLQAFYKIAENDSLLKPLINQLYGLRIIGIPNLFEALCWGIIGQQINLPFAYRLKREFVEAFGSSISHNGETYWIFPSYMEIAKLTTDTLSKIKMTKRKSEYIIGIAKMMASGTLSKSHLLQLHDFKKIEKELINIRGIGPWTANYCLMRCLRYPNAFPIADVGLQNAVKFFKGMDRKPTEKELTELAIPWKGYEAYATFYLWRGFSTLEK